MALTNAECRTATPGPKLEKLSDGGGLQLWVQPTGARLWRLAYRFRGKQKLLALGAYPTVSLSRARQARDDAKRLLAAGVDPGTERKRLTRKQAAAVTFRAIADEYLLKLKRERRAEATLTKAKWLLAFATAEFGETPIKDVDAPLILRALQAVERRGRYESARRLRSTVGSAFRYAIATARVNADPTYALRGALTHARPTPRAAITDPAALGALLRAIEAFDGQPGTRIALQLMALLFPRPGELRAAEWVEFDFSRAIWAIPAARTKMRRPHRVPLSRQAVDLLLVLKSLCGTSNLLFPSVRSLSRPISDNTMNAALRRLGYTKNEVTVHGFRASASSLLNEAGRWHPDAIERPTRPRRGKRDACCLCPRRVLGRTSGDDAMVG
jgi:integrase